MVALTVVSLAAGAHTLAGGELPVPGILLALLALTGLASTAATRLKLSFPALAALLGAGQLMLHEAFALSGQVPAGAIGSAHHAGATLAPVAADQIHLQLPALGSTLPLLMFAGHALATLACALLLARGEAALWSLAAWLRPLLRLPAPVKPDAGEAPVAAGWPAEAAPLPWRNLRRDCRRGPPAVVLS